MKTRKNKEKKFTPPKSGMKKEIYDYLCEQYDWNFDDPETRNKIISEYRRLTEIPKTDLAKNIRHLFFLNQKLTYTLDSLKKQKETYRKYQEDGDIHKNQNRLKKLKKTRARLRKAALSLHQLKKLFYKEYYYKISLLIDKHEAKKYVQNIEDITDIVVKKIISQSIRNALGFSDFPLTIIRYIINSTIVDQTRHIPDIPKYLNIILKSEREELIAIAPNIKKLYDRESETSISSSNQNENKILRELTTPMKNINLSQLEITYSLLSNHRSKEEKYRPDVLFDMLGEELKIDLLSEAIEKAPSQYREYLKKQYLEVPEGGKKLKKVTAKEIGVYDTQIAKIERKAFKWIKTYIESRLSKISKRGVK